MKKKKTRKLIIAILLIIATIFIISKIIGNKKENVKRLANLYEKLNISQTYLVEMEHNDENKTIMAQMGDKTIIDQYTPNNHTTTIVKDNNTYLVLHDREEYYIYEQNNVEQNILTEGLREVITKEFITGEQKIKGKKYEYEEFTGSTMFMSSRVLGSAEEEIKTRFYFDKDDNLVYIQTIKGANQELLKINIEKEVDDSIFEIPSHYAEG